MEDIPGSMAHWDRTKARVPAALSGSVSAVILTPHGGWGEKLFTGLPPLEWSDERSLLDPPMIDPPKPP